MQMCITILLNLILVQNTVMLYNILMTVRYVITCVFQISFIQICTQLLGPNTFNFRCLCIIFKSICDDEVEISVDLLSQVLTT